MTELPDSKDGDLWQCTSSCRLVLNGVLQGLILEPTLLNIHNDADYGTARTLSKSVDNMKQKRLADSLLTVKFVI